MNKAEKQTRKTTPFTIAAKNKTTATTTKKLRSWALVTHTYNPSYLEAEIRRIMVQGQPGKKTKSMRPPSQPIARHDSTCLSSQLCRTLRLRGAWFQVSPANKVCETPLQGKKVGHGGMHLSFQL
jgi:hypothetical protein